MFDFDLEMFSGKNVLLAPYNDITSACIKDIITNHGEFVGFHDAEKKGPNIYDISNLPEYDIVIVASPTYWKVVAEKFPIDKVVVANLPCSKYCYYQDYKQAIDSNSYYDLLFFSSFEYSSSYVISLFQALKKTNFKFGFYRECIPSRAIDELPDEYLFDNTMHETYVNTLVTDFKLASHFTNAISKIVTNHPKYFAIESLQDLCMLSNEKSEPYDLVFNISSHLGTQCAGISTGNYLSQKLLQEQFYVPNKSKILLDLDVAAQNEFDNLALAAELESIYQLSHPSKSYTLEDESDDFYEKIRNASICITTSLRHALLTLLLRKQAILIVSKDSELLLYKKFSKFITCNTLTNLNEKEITLLISTAHNFKTEHQDKIKDLFLFSSSVNFIDLLVHRLEVVFTENYSNDASINRKFKMNPDYLSLKSYVHYDDTECGDEWQTEVYLHAAHLMKVKKYNSVLDIGCGSGYKLINYLGEFDTIGLEVEENINFLKNKYPDRIWKESCFVSDDVCNVDLIVCSDVIEHLVDPVELLSYVAKQDFSHFVISTPSREFLYPADSMFHSGPPSNKAHQREWSFSEFENLLFEYFDVIDHRVTNGLQATQMAICVKKKCCFDEV